jgi:hypothetical protein
VVGNDGLLGRGGGGADDFEAAVELEGVGVDNFSIKTACVIQGEFRLAGSGGATDVEDYGFQIADFGELEREFSAA